MVSGKPATSYKLLATGYRLLATTYQLNYSHADPSRLSDGRRVAGDNNRIARVCRERANSILERRRCRARAADCQPSEISHQSIVQTPIPRRPRRCLSMDRKVAGRAADTRGLFWTFDATDLEPGRRYELQILDARGRAVCDPWPLATFPSPGDSPAQLRLVIYSCAGGHDVLPDHKPTDVSTHRFLTIDVRRRMLARAMSFAPDAVVANGDHIYWDLRSERADLSAIRRPRERTQASSIAHSRCSARRRELS